MRQALGGAEALANVKTFSLNGSVSRNFGERTLQSDVEMICELPDKCLRVARQLGGPVTTTMTDGYNGDEPIREVDRRLPPPPFMTPQDMSPDAVARRRAAMAGHNKEEFARLTIALFGASFSGYPLEFSYIGPDNLDGRAMDALDVKGGKDFSGRLLVDAETHLPAALIWKTPPLIMMTTSQTVMTRRSTGETREVNAPAVDAPRKLPPGAVAVTSTPTPDFAASLPLVERRRQDPEPALLLLFVGKGGHVADDDVVHVPLGGGGTQAIEIGAADLSLRHEPLAVVDAEALRRDQLVHHQFDDGRAQLRRRERPAAGGDADVGDGNRRPGHRLLGHGTRRERHAQEPDNEQADQLPPFHRVLLWGEGAGWTGAGSLRRRETLRVDLRVELDGVDLQVLGQRAVGEVLDPARPH